MLRILVTATVLALTSLSARAHFVFVVPDVKDPLKVVVVFSDDLEPDENVSVEKMASLKLTCRDASGKEVAVKHQSGKHELTSTLPGSGYRIVFGTLHYGVMQKGDSKPYLLAYHPKAIIGAGASDKDVNGEKLAPVELIPVVSKSEVCFKFLSSGKPVANAEITVIKPDGSKSKVKTNKEGLTQLFSAKGRYAAWAKDVVAIPGEHGGKKFEEVRHYATLVVGFPAD